MQLRDDKWQVCHSVPTKGPGPQRAFTVPGRDRKTEKSVSLMHNKENA